MSGSMMASAKLTTMAALLLLSCLAGCTGDKADDTGGGNGGDGSADDSDAPVDMDLDDDGYSSTVDCDDTSAAISPGATEVCDGIDNDCDDLTDEDGAATDNTWYADGDGDDYGDPGTPIHACFQPDGTTTNGDDCDDANAARNPGLDEVCDDLDNDCDGEVDEEGAADGFQVRPDADGDGYGDDGISLIVCAFEDGYVANEGDCDDADVEINPAADEVCDGVDNNCDGEADEDTADDAETWYGDADEDGYGADEDIAVACEAPTGYVSRDGDCDDDDRRVYPTATERCDDVDNNCDGVTDDDAVDRKDWYLDVDEDTYGLTDTLFTQCDEPSDANYALVDGDCDDENATVNPGMDEACDDADGLDNNCDGTVDGTCYYGDLNHQEGEGRTAGTRTCDSWWDLVWRSTAEVCAECDWTFDVDLSYDSSISDDERGCVTPAEQEMTWTLGVDTDYYGSGTAMVWYLTSGSYYYYYYEDYDYDYGSSDAEFIPRFAATWDGSTGALTFEDGPYDEPYYVGRRLYYVTDWYYGTATLDVE